MKASRLARRDRHAPRGAAYMIVSLNRWEWNRALFFGLIVLIAEVGLATALVLRKLGQLEHRSAPDPDTLAAIRSTRPASPDRFEWLKQSAGGQMNVFITFLVAGGVLVSGGAWVVDRLGREDVHPDGRETPGGGARADRLSGGRSGGRRRHGPRPGHARRR